MPPPTVGRIVQYTLTEADARSLNAFGGNAHAEGDIYPALIVRVWSEETVQLQVFGDGPAAMLWATSRTAADSSEAGRWHWPAWR